MKSMQNTGFSSRTVPDTSSPAPHTSSIARSMQEATSARTSSTYVHVNGEIHPITVKPSELVHCRVAAQARSTPDATAIVSGQQHLRYAQLNEHANRLARYFRSIGIGRESVVALWLRRSSSFIVSALAAFKAGAAYLPLDASSPPDRLQYMVADSGAEIVVTESTLAERARGAHSPLLVFDEFCTSAAKLDPNDFASDTLPSDLAYVIYTSGSTGTPKGVEITHSNLVNLIAWHRRTFQVLESDRASHLAGLGFDASVWEIWPYLTSGASLYLAAPDTLNSPESLQSWLVSNEISVSFVPTPMAEPLIGMDWPANTKLRLLLTGGDRLHVQPRPDLPFSLINNYGPTECTVVATSGPVQKTSGSSLPSIGMPIDNTQVRILSETLQPVAPGEIGELYIGGANVGRGYRKRPDLTSERFIPDPLMPDFRLYKTGDLGRYLPGGEIEFMGRADNQIKIRGYRIEPEEIVAQLNSHPSVTASAVVARSGDGEDKRLIAYVVMITEATRTELQEFLLKQLPDYMVPATFVLISALPLTANGKVDTANLPAPDKSNTLIDDSTRSLTPVEATLAPIVASLLKIPHVDPDDDFFLLGGHSLMGTQLIARIHDAFDVDVPLRALFERPTVRDLAEEIERLLLNKIDSMSEEEAQRALSQRDGGVNMSAPSQTADNFGSRRSAA